MAKENLEDNREVEELVGYSEISEKQYMCVWLAKKNRTTS